MAADAIGQAAGAGGVHHTAAALQRQLLLQVQLMCGAAAGVDARQAALGAQHGLAQGAQGPLCGRLALRAGQGDPWQRPAQGGGGLCVLVLWE